MFWRFLTWRDARVKIFYANKPRECQKYFRAHRVCQKSFSNSPNKHLGISKILKSCQKKKLILIIYYYVL